MNGVPTDWWQDFFSGVVVDFWVQVVPAEQTQREADFIQKKLAVRPGGHLLDVPCGAGRLTLALAGAGYRLTGVDYSTEFLARGRAIAAERKLPVTWTQANMRDLPWTAEFDGAFCCGNSFGYLDDAGNAAFLVSVFRSLKPGARFVLDYPAVLEARLPAFQARNWFQAGSIFFLEDERYDPATGRLVTEYTFLREGAVEKRAATHRCYTSREVCHLLTAAGFAHVEAYGSLQEEPFRLGSQGLLLVAHKAS